MIIYIIILIILCVLLISFYLVKYRKLPIDVWKPGAAWTRAFIYFTFCNIVSAVTGTLDAILSHPIATAEQLSNPSWIIFCVTCFVYIFIAYFFSFIDSCCYRTVSAIAICNKQCKSQHHNL